MPKKLEHEDNVLKSLKDRVNFNSAVGITLATSAFQCNFVSHKDCYFLILTDLTISVVCFMTLDNTCHEIAIYLTI